MSGSDKSFQYSVARALHWAVGAIIAFNVLSGWRLDSFEPDIKKVLVMIHASVGTVIFFAMLFRWWWRRTNNLYSPPRWWKRPSMLLQWVFYPLVLMQVVFGVTHAAFIDYEVLGFGFIPFSALAADDETLHALFFRFHTVTAWILIALIVVHAAERGRQFFIDDDGAAVAQEPTNP